MIITPAAAVGILLIAPFVGGLLLGIDRIITARLQSRVGPPLLQPFYDIFKLLGKEPIVSNRFQVVYAYLHLGFMVLGLYLLITGQDGLMLLFVLAFSSLALILGGMSVRSPYSRIGSQREVLLMVAYEPILILMVVGFYLLHGDFQISRVWGADEPMLWSLPLLFAAYLMVILIKLQKSPFDVATSHHAHQEIVKGVTIEFAGPYLAVLEIAHCYEVVLFLLIVALFWSTSVVAGGLLVAAVFFGAILVDNLVARMTTTWAFSFMWTSVLGLAATNVFWLYWR